MPKVSVLVIAWTSRPARAKALAEVLGGGCFICFPQPFGARTPTAIRYAVSLWMTAWVLIRSRPHVVLAQNPPVFAALLASLLTRGSRLILDCHPASFGDKGNRQGRMMLPVTRRLARRSAAVLVTTADYVDRLRAWGSCGLIIHEPPLDPVLSARVTAGAARDGHAPSVLFACVFAADEPVGAVIAAARELPEVVFKITGNPDLCPVAPQDMPHNVRLTGFLGFEDFLREMACSDAVLSLTTEPNSVARSGYEAVYLERPLVISDVPSMVENFSGAVTCKNTSEGIAGAVRDVTAQPPSAQALGQAARRQRSRWAEQERGLRAAARLGDPA